MTLTIDTEWPSHTVPLNTGLTVDCFSSVERDLSRWGITSHFFKHFFMYIIAMNLQSRL